MGRDIVKAKLDIIFKKIFPDTEKIFQKDLGLQN